MSTQIPVDTKQPQPLTIEELLTRIPTRDREERGQVLASLKEHDAVLVSRIAEQGQLWDVHTIISGPVEWWGKVGYMTRTSGGHEEFIEYYRIHPAIEFTQQQLDMFFQPPPD